VVVKGCLFDVFSRITFPNQPVKRTHDTAAEYVDIDLRRLDAHVADLLPIGPDVAPSFQQVRCEVVAEGGKRGGERTFYFSCQEGRGLSPDLSGKSRMCPFSLGRNLFVVLIHVSIFVSIVVPIVVVAMRSAATWPLPISLRLVLDDDLDDDRDKDRDKESSALDFPISSSSLAERLSSAVAVLRHRLQRGVLGPHVRSQETLP
jgi:hypothetical protein